VGVHPWPRLLSREGQRGCFAFGQSCHCGITLGGASGTSCGLGASSADIGSIGFSFPLGLGWQRCLTSQISIGLPPIRTVHAVLHVPKPANWIRRPACTTDSPEVDAVRGSLRTVMPLYQSLPISTSLGAGGGSTFHVVVGPYGPSGAVQSEPH
jgi:hypothetical protein